MCDKCNKLEETLQKELERPRMTKTHWWVGIMVTIIIFVSGLIYASGKIINSIDTHVADGNVHHNNRVLEDTYVNEKEFKEYKDETKDQLNRIENLVNDINKFLRK